MSVLKFTPKITGGVQNREPGVAADEHKRMLDLVERINELTAIVAESKEINEIDRLRMVNKYLVAITLIVESISIYRDASSKSTTG